MLSQFYTQSQPQDLLSKPGVLAVIQFQDSCSAPTTPGCVPIGLPSLSGEDYEVVKVGNSPVQRGITQGCHWAFNDSALFIATWLTPEDCLNIQEAGESAYMKLFAQSAALGFSLPVRIWNFIPRINQGAGDHEEYKRFCVGRQKAFDKLGLSKADYPAASALGHHSEGAVVYMLCLPEAGKHHENPRQEPAYRYPREYGPCSPSFARATSIGQFEHRQILISGTASILGHDTKAAGDLMQQLNITVENIRLLQESIDANAKEFSPIRVYLRYESDYAVAQEWLRKQFPNAHLTILLADICRSNLLVEIECTANMATVAHAVHS